MRSCMFSMMLMLSRRQTLRWRVMDMKALMLSKTLWGRGLTAPQRPCQSRCVQLPVYSALPGSRAADSVIKSVSFSFQINLIAPPRYVMTTTTLERTEGLSVLHQAMTTIKERIEEKRGVFNVQMEVRHFRASEMH